MKGMKVMLIVLIILVVGVVAVQLFVKDKIHLADGTTGTASKTKSPAPVPSELRQVETLG